MLRTVFMATIFLATAAFPQSFTLLSPNGGETLTSGQPATIRWTPNNTNLVRLDYSVDNGTTWINIGTEYVDTLATEEGNITWTPLVNKQVDKALFRITAHYVTSSSSDMSDSSFVIVPSPDGSEPNDDFSSAYPISVGDSVVKNALVFGVDSLESDPSFFDVDYYKLTLEAGKLVTISPFPRDTTCFKRSIKIRFAVYDSSKSLLYSEYARTCLNNSDQKLSGYGVPQTGTYYLEIKITSYSFENVQPVHYGLSVQQRDIAGLITLITPNGGETFSAEDTVTVQWQADDVLFDIDIQYSIDSGKSWRSPFFAIGAENESSTYAWLVPHLKQGTDRALIKAFACNITNPPFDVSNGTFTILASATDAYEPNDDFASAKAVGFGDSVVKNAIVMKSFVGSDSMGIDTSLTDNDFFKLNLTAGSVVTISDDCCQLCQLDWIMYVLIRLFDSSKNQIGTDFGSLSCYIPQSGTYYCEISSMCEMDYWNKYCLSIHQMDGAITLISPNGGENLHAGQSVTIRWSADSLPGSIDLFYSRNNGTSWERITSLLAGNESLLWDVPALKTRTDQALIKVVAGDAITNPPSDISDGTFTIQAAPTDDPYEPNNDFSSAYSIAAADSVVKNALVYRYADIPDDASGTVESDTDFFKVNLTAESLVMIHCWISEGGDAAITVGDASQNVVPVIRNSPGFNYYRTRQAGVYYIRTLASGKKGAWSKYGLSIKSITVLAAQESVPDTAAMHFDSSSAAYRSRIVADTTKLTIDLALYEKYHGRITTMTLSPNDLAILPDEKSKVKAFAILPTFSSWELTTTDIAVAYTLSDLNGYPEKKLAVACLNYLTSNEWFPVAGSIDTIKHQIVFQTGALPAVNIFQVYVKSDIGISRTPAETPSVFGVQANALNRKQSIAVHFSLPSSVNADLMLYDIQGKCVRRGIFTAGPGNSTVQWNLGSLANGKYILRIKAGRYHTQKTLLLINH